MEIFNIIFKIKTYEQWKYISNAFSTTGVVKQQDLRHKSSDKIQHFYFVHNFIYDLPETRRHFQWTIEETANELKNR